MKSPSKKINKNSTPKIIDPISVTMGRDWYSWRERPVSEAYINQLCEELLEWAVTDKKALRVSTWIRERKISRQTVKHWRAAFPQFNAAYAEAMEAIGDRREIGAIEKTYDANSVFRSLHQFDSEWHESVNKYHSDLKKEEEASKKQDITVIYSPVPEHDLIKKSTS